MQLHRACTGYAPNIHYIYAFVHTTSYSTIPQVSFLTQSYFQPKNVTWRTFATKRITNTEKNLGVKNRKKKRNKRNTKKILSNLNTGKNVDNKKQIEEIREEQIEEPIVLDMDKPLPMAWKVIFAIFCGSIVSYVYGRIQKHLQKSKPPVIKEMGKPMVGGSFDLIDQDGKQRTSKDFFGKYLFIYFGFINCPDICPLAMKTVKEALEIGKKDNLPDIETLFISVDPRDTIEQLKEFKEREYHPKDMVCLTGSLSNLLETTKKYRVYTNMVSIAKKVEEQKKNGNVHGTELLVDHSDFVYLINPKGEFLNVLNPRNLGAENMEEKIAQEISQDQQPGGKIWT